jgi:hypothetical protein
MWGNRCIGRPKADTFAIPGEYSLDHEETPLDKMTIKQIPYPASMKNN